MTQADIAAGLDTENTEQTCRTQPFDRQTVATRAAAANGYLFGPLTDFLGLGGGSLFILGILYLALPRTPAAMAGVAVTMAVLAHFINNPHFANSYQIFYRGYATKAFGWQTTPGLRLRYILAGIVVPIALVVFFATAVVRGDAWLLGFGANVMGLLVGWHYVKQGYGMIVVDSVLKKNFFDAHDKRVLMINAYAVWAASWLYLNHVVGDRNLFGLKAFVFHIPMTALWAAFAVAAITGLMSLAVIWRKWRRGPRHFPWAGASAYVASLYVWLLTGRADPLLLLVIPACHSLQYLLVVWRFQLNFERGRQPVAVEGAPPPGRRWDRPALRFALFALLGVTVGYLGFWGVPKFLDASVAYSRALFGPSLFMFMFWVFINVHHYFMDNVMWRRENPEAGRYLFAAH